MKTVIDAVNELKGDLNNSLDYDYEIYLSFCHVTDIWVATDVNETLNTHWEVCTCDEFNDLVSQMKTNFGECANIDIFNYTHGTKELLTKSTKELEVMDIDWSKAPGGATHYGIESGNYYSGFYKIISSDEGFFHDKSQWLECGSWPELIERPQPKPLKPIDFGAIPDDKPVFTQAMADNGESVKVGMLFATRVDGNYKAAMVNGKSVCFVDEDGFLIGIPLAWAKPIDTRTDKEKAIDDLFKLDESICNNTKWHENFIDAIIEGKVHGVSFQPLTVEVK